MGERVAGSHRLAYIFPGQGSQRVGMGRHLVDLSPSVTVEYFDCADDVLGFPLSRLCFEGPDEELVKTENQQPAIFLVSVATAAVLRARGLKPEAVAGHSVGEYAALAAAGAISFEDGIRLTRRRGLLMAEVAKQTGGLMAAVLGLSAEEVVSICRDASAQGIVEPANFNSPAQTVISGEESAVRRAMDLARECGARKVVQLAVSAPFHCSLMAPLARTFRPDLDAADIRDPLVPIVANVTADYELTGAEVRDHLQQQLASPVRWTDSIRRLAQDGVDSFIEVGPGKVLTGLLRSIDESLTGAHTADAAALERATGEYRSDTGRH